MIDVQIHTDYGRVEYDDSTATVAANGSQLRAWASRPGNVWPCSELAEASEIIAAFDRRGLIDLSGDDCIDLSADELNAWSSDVLRDTLPKDHPAYYATVGQFESDR